MARSLAPRQSRLLTSIPVAKQAHDFDSMLAWTSFLLGPGTGVKKMARSPAQLITSW